MTSALCSNLLPISRALGHSIAIHPQCPACALTPTCPSPHANHTLTNCCSASPRWVLWVANPLLLSPTHLLLNSLCSVSWWTCLQRNPPLYCSPWTPLWLLTYLQNASEPLGVRNWLCWRGLPFLQALWAKPSQAEPDPTNYCLQALAHVVHVTPRHSVCSWNCSGIG